MRTSASRRSSANCIPIMEELARQEKRRWEMTTGHWDDVLKEVSLD